MELNKDKLPMIYQVMKEEAIDAWLIVARSTDIRSEPILPVLGELSFDKTTALLFTQSGHCIVLVDQAEVGVYRKLSGCSEVIAYQRWDDTLQKVLEREKPAVLALNFSSDDSSADGLTYGFMCRLEAMFAKMTTPPQRVSAHRIIRKVRGMKTASQIEKIRHCAVKADEYLRLVPSICKEGTTSLDIFNFLHEVAYKDGYGMSWLDAQCPGVSVDPNVPAGHMGIVSTPILKGYVINIDYGVNYDGYCSDLQRMYYVLKDDETDVPEDIKQAFYLVRDAIDEARAFMKPGVTGFQVDQIARHKIVDNGYDSWNAALGHQVGHVTHDGGTILANRRARYNKAELIDVPLDEGNVFTIEPSVMTHVGRIGLEEDVVITAEGTHWLVEPQREFILIRI